MRNAGRLKLGYYPLPVIEATRLKGYLTFPPEPFSAIDPCIGTGAAFIELLDGQPAQRYGIELDVNRAIESQALGVDTWHADALEMRCAVETMSFLYLNPPYDFEVGPSGSNKRMELVFLKHTCRWLKPGGVLAFIIPQIRVKECARVLAEYFTNIRVFRLTEPECVRFNQVATLATRRRRDEKVSDAALSQAIYRLEELATHRSLESITVREPQSIYQIPPSGPVSLRHDGLPLDDLEDALLRSAAYRQLSTVILRQREQVKGRPITPLHGGHVGLLCTAGLLDGVFGKGEARHIARWRSIKYVDHWEEEGDEGGRIVHDCERFSQELTLLYADGRTAVLTHEKKGKTC